MNTRISSPASATNLTARQIVLWSIWLGLLTGLGESGMLALRMFVLDRITRLGVDSLWMGPVVDVLIFTLAGVILSFMAIWWAPIRSLRWVSFVLIAIAIFTFSLVSTRITHFAGLLLALGVSSQASRLVVFFSEPLMKLRRMTMPWLALAVAGIALLIFII